jgi:hypothetical protein
LLQLIVEGELLIWRQIHGSPKTIYPLSITSQPIIEANNGFCMAIINQRNRWASAKEGKHKL